MNKKVSNPFIYFYGKHDISPVHQDISDFQLHLKRREKLYRLLGIAPIVFSGKKILEIGPGGGYNSLAFFQWQSSVDFIEPNPTAQRELFQLLKKYRIDKKKWNLFPCRIEDFSNKRKYGIIIAEGFIPGLFDRRKIVSKISELIVPGGIIVVTCVDEIGFLFELIKRIIGHRLLYRKKVETFGEKVKLLSRAFFSHLRCLPNASRPVRDWVTDSFLNPGIYGKFFSITEAIEEFGKDFILLGSSPAMFTDYSWYKDVDYDSRESTLEQFYKKRHMLILYSLKEETRRSIEANSFLNSLVSELRKLASKVENNLNQNNIKYLVSLLKKISISTADIDARIPEAINEGIELLLDKDLDELKISKASNLAMAFGKGQQYISLVNIFAK